MQKFSTRYGIMLLCGKLPPASADRLEVHVAVVTSSKQLAW